MRAATFSERGISLIVYSSNSIPAPLLPSAAPTRKLVLGIEERRVRHVVDQANREWPRSRPDVENSHVCVTQTDLAHLRATASPRPICGQFRSVTPGTRGLRDFFRAGGHRGRLSEASRRENRPRGLGSGRRATAQRPSQRQGLSAINSRWSARRPRWCSPWTDDSVQAQAIGDLARSQADHVTQDDDFALLLGQRGQRLAHRVHLTDVRIGVRTGLGKGFDRGEAPVGPQVIDGDVPGHPQQPSEERDAAIVVLADRGHELREHVLRHVLRLRDRRGRSSGRSRRCCGSS